MSNNFKMKVDVINYSIIIHTMLSYLFLVNIFNLEYYSVYVFV